MSNEFRDKIYIIWVRCDVVSLVGATHCPCFELSGVLFGEKTNCVIIVYGRVCSRTIDSPINWGS